MSARLFDRVGFVTLLCVASSVLVLARVLEPAASGVGTHEQLGLPPCGMLVFTGLPCPACGLTTAFAHLARFELALSIHANPLGLPLFLLTLACVPLSLVWLLRGRTLMGIIDALEADKWSLRFVVAALVVWGARLAQHAL